MKLNKESTEEVSGVRGDKFTVNVELTVSAASADDVDMFVKALIYRGLVSLQNSVEQDEEEDYGQLHETNITEISPAYVF